ncbi:MAG TPA: methyltransferase domain-containing protein [Pyrinomonadaceae bacterium]|nr:methyltransferase domain-containing protein [Pyrinomonadaceae bacterium]
MTDDHLRLEFNEWARAGRGPGMEKGHRPVGEQAINRLGLTADSLALDVGCGSGWATRLMAEHAPNGHVVGIDISDEMIGIARSTSADYPNVRFEVATAEKLPFLDGEFTHAFSMESLYYYSRIDVALKEIHRVLQNHGRFVTVVDLYKENEPSHQWIPTLKVPVQLLSTAEYDKLLGEAGFVNIVDSRLHDPTPVPDDYSGGSFATREDYVRYKENGSLMLSAEVRK